VLQAFGQVADVLQALTHDGQLMAAQKYALDEASESARLQRISYSGGASGILQLLDAQRQYQQARLGYVRAEVLRYQDTIQLLVAMGWLVGHDPCRGQRRHPGWKTAPVTHNRPRLWISR
jgi:outer membrane protein TolC